MKLRSLFDSVSKGGHLKHAWFLGIVFLAFSGYNEPMALQALAVKASQVWLGAVMGHWIFKGRPRNDKDEITLVDMACWCFLVGMVINAFARG